MDLEVFLRVAASPRMPHRLVEALVRIFAKWRIRQLRRIDRKADERSGATKSLESPLYLLDGYHGGLPFWDWILLPKGGLWRELLWPTVGEVVVRRAGEGGIPAALELDGYTYAVMAAGQAQSVARLKEAVDAGTIELLNGTFAQPFLGTLSGESVVRQFAHGLASIERELGVRVTSYASQEPCFCAQLPQILAGFGFEQALVRTHWAPFGTDPTVDADLVRWQGPDGSKILAVPRYTCLDYESDRDTHPGVIAGTLRGTVTRRAGWQTFTSEARSCGVALPLASSMTDLNPVEAPFPEAVALHADPDVHLTTLRGYCDAALGERDPGALPALTLAPDDFELTLPWGLEGDVLMQARDRAEAALLVAERADALAHALGGATREASLHGAWQELLLAQHHDLHVCGPWLSRAHGKPMSAVGCDLCTQAEKTARGVTQASLAELLARAEDAGLVGRALLVFNPDAHLRREVVRVSVPGLIFDGERVVPTQPDGEGVAFVCDLPPLGWRIFDLREGEPQAKLALDLAPVFRNESYLAVLGEDGALTLSTHGRMLVEDGASLRVWRDGKWWDSRDGVSACEVLADGAVFATWRVRGSLGSVTFAQDFTLYRALPRVDVTVQLDFGAGTHFGPQPDDGDGYYALDERKMCACFPTGPGQTMRDAPFLAGETARQRFIGASWAAVDKEGFGIAVLAPGARGYAYDRKEAILRRVLAWSPRAWMYASDDSVTRGQSRHTILRGRHTFRYALLPYYRRAEAIAAATHYRLPVATVLGRPPPGEPSAEYQLEERSRRSLPAKGSLLRVEPQSVELSALFVRDGAAHARLWNPDAAPREAIIRANGDLVALAVDLRLEDGERLPAGRVPLRPWGVQTVQVDGLRPYQQGD